MIKTLLIIDGNYQMNRAWYAIPQTMTTHSGQPINATYGFCLYMFDMIKSFNATHVAVTFDPPRTEQNPNPTWRHEEYAGYKEGRKPKPVEFKRQFSATAEILNALNIGFCMIPRHEVDGEMIPGCEADDIIAAIAHQADQQHIQAVIASADKDLYQLVTPSVSVWTGGKKTPEMITPDYLWQKEKLTPYQYLETKILMGDKSDNLPGIDRVGEKTAPNLIKQFGSIATMYMELHKVESAVVRKNLETQKRRARFNYKMMYLNPTRANVTLHRFNNQPIGNYSPHKALTALHKYNLMRLQHHLPPVITLNQPNPKLTQPKPVFAIPTPNQSEILPDDEHVFDEHKTELIYQPTLL